jgi:hypothetical protein
MGAGVEVAETSRDPSAVTSVIRHTVSTPAPHTASCRPAISLVNPRRGCEPSGPRHRLQTFERQAFRVLDAGEIKPADKGCDGIAITVGQRNHGIDGDSLGLHGLPHVVLNLDREKLRAGGLIRR